MPWAYIYRLLGPGLHWNKPQKVFRDAFLIAKQDNQQDAAEHINIIWDMRNVVMMENKEDPGE